MSKSATEVMQEIIFSAVIDAITALKAGSGGMQNALLRDLNTVHANTTFADLPKPLQAAIGESVRSAFTKLLKEGYAVSDRKLAQSDPRPPRSQDQRLRPQAPRRPGGNPGPRRGPRTPR
ncbi:hypothetical protein [Allosphingosinicella vermicomposti]|uniref:hypothetical protein n=1 Tax=Allosphingosinicella vermicomposti TaxID=614671 RepID=UPI000D109991|nr:hypothetical protein [Allosphingosinicella vermicomposti]